MVSKLPNKNELRTKENARSTSSLGSKAALSRSVAVAALAPILSALAVEEQFEPTLLEKSALRKVAGRLFDALLMAPPRRSSPVLPEVDSW